jgi:hypothetical protein
MEKKPLNEGSTRGQIKGGVQKTPAITTSERPIKPPPAPTKKKS